MTASRIDAHHHLWRLDRGDYHWMPQDGPLASDHLAAELSPELAASGIDATVVVQAAATTDETRFLLEQQREIGPVHAVVGWAPLERPDLPELLEGLADPALVGLRSMLQDLDDPAWIMRPEVRRNLAILREHGLRFDLLATPRELPAAYEALAAEPDLQVVIDHLAKPTYGPERDADWKRWMRRFAGRPGTTCKLSGLVTEVGVDWRGTDFRPYVDFIFESFGAERVMFGSDWPVCRLVADYSEVVALAERLTEGLGPADAHGFWAGNAARFYGVDVG